MKLFHGWLSSASRRVRLCFAEKGIAYEGVAIDMSKQEQHSPEYLAMNPNGVVPSLLIGPGQSLYESSTICEYLDDIQPEPPLRPADPYERAVHIPKRRRPSCTLAASRICGALPTSQTLGWESTKSRHLGPNHVGAYNRARKTG